MLPEGVAELTPEWRAAIGFFDNLALG
jgi:hypothetical protein